MPATEAILEACKAFSLGNLDGALDTLSDDVAWEIVGQKNVRGVEAVEAFCEEMTQDGMPDFVIERITAGPASVAIEGRDTEDTLRFCDVYTVTEVEITAITSYCLCPADTPKTASA